MSADSMYVLVEMKGITVNAGNSSSGFMGGTSSIFQTHAGGGGGSPAPSEIRRVIRTYESRERADEDMELLRVATPAATYRVLDVPHIER